MQIVALTGQARSGKTYVAQELAKIAFNKGLLPVFVSFAGALKREAAELGYDKDTLPDKYRTYCQDRGAEMRIEDPDYWVKETAKEIVTIAQAEKESIKNNDKHWERVVLIDDVRYLNEIALIAKMDGVFIHVYAGSRLPDPEGEWRQHESESLSKIIDGTKEDLDKREFIFCSNREEDDDKPDYDISVFWLDNETTKDKLSTILEKFGPFFLGIRLVGDVVGPPATDSITIDLLKEKYNKLQGFLDQILGEIDDDEQGWRPEDDGWSPGNGPTEDPYSDID